MTNTCSTVTPGQPLSSWQQLGLNIVSFWQGRDVVLAIDLTESVGLNDEGRIRLRQIVKDSLQKGDRVYVVPFATEVYSTDAVIEFREKEDIDKILDAIPFQADSKLQNTDIQKAESYIYPQLAGINQCRLLENSSIRPQSVVWLTDAPLLTSPGIDSETWIETPANSPFRKANSPESQQREGWLEALPFEMRSRSISTEDNRQYDLTVVDIKTTVQEFCTPAPGGRETCLVTPYLVRQLWLPSLIVGLGIIGGAVLLFTLMSWRKKWQLIIDDTQDEEQICYLRHKQRISIGEDIDCPGSEIRAYIERSGNKLFLIPTRVAPIYYNGQEIITKTSLSASSFRLNCPNASKGNQDFEIFIRVKK